MKVLLFILILLLLAAVGGGAYFFGENKQAQEKLNELEDSNTDLQFKVNSLENQVAALSKKIEEEVEKLSEEKEQEIGRLQEAQNQLIEELKNEIEQKQVQITQLADRLSVSMVDKILFPSGKAELTTDGLAVLKRVGNIIKTVEGKEIRVEGHTDNVPIHPRLQKEFPSNWELSTARATNVVRFLQDEVGVNPVKLQAVGLSQYHPISSNKTKAGRSQNRRIEIALLPISGSGPVATK